MVRLNQAMSALWAVLLCSAVLADAPPNYRVKVLTSIDGAFSTRARALNDLGEIAGDTDLGDLTSRVLHWASADAAPTEMTGFGADVAFADDINNAGVVVGSASEGLVAFSWLAGEDLVSLDDPIICCAFASGINDAGLIVGNSSTTGELAAQWDDGEITSFPAPDGGCCSVAQDINEQGQVVGGSAGLAVLWDADQTVEIGGLGGLFSMAYSINSSGEVAGTATDDQGGFLQPFHWNGGEMVVLPLLGGLYGEAKAINDAGAIVGMSTIPPVPGQVSARATIWLDGEAFNLNDFTVNLAEDAVMTRAVDINEHGQIVGFINLGFQTNAFFLDPLSGADLDSDGVVGAADLAILLGSWGPCPAEGDCPADLDGDGMVGPADLAILLGEWG